METRTTSSAAVSEVLNVDNYLVWSVQVKTYLIAQDLWDIIEDDEDAFKDGGKKNATALHVIQISCPQRICHVISLITSAKIAWKTLEEICRIPKSDYVGMSLSILHVLEHFIPQIGQRSRRCDNKLTQKKKP